MRFINAFAAAAAAAATSAIKSLGQIKFFCQIFAYMLRLRFAQHSLKHFPFSTLRLIIHDEYLNARTHTRAYTRSLIPAQRVTVDTVDEPKKCCVLWGARAYAGLAPHSTVLCQLRTRHESSSALKRAHLNCT